MLGGVVSRMHNCMHDYHSYRRQKKYHCNGCDYKSYCFRIVHHVSPSSSIFRVMRRASINSNPVMNNNGVRATITINHTGPSDSRDSPVILPRAEIYSFGLFNTKAVSDIYVAENMAKRSFIQPISSLVLSIFATGRPCIVRYASQRLRRR